MNLISKTSKTLILFVIGVLVIGVLSGDAFAGATYDYYASGRVKNVTYSPAVGGVTFEEYLDEDWLGQGFGRVQKKVLASADADGAKSYVYTYPLETVLLSARLGGAAGDDVVVAAGSDGLWTYVDDSTWTQISTGVPETMAKAKLNANAIDDIVIDFGAAGLWQYTDNASWTRISATNAEGIGVGDLDNSGIDDVVIDFGSTGLWTYSNNSSWAMVSASNAKAITVGDLDNNSQADVVVDFGTLGLYKYMNGAAWSKVSDSTTEKVIIADMDNNGTKDMVVDFGSLGLYKYMNNTTWEKISDTNAENVLVDDFDNNGTNDMIVDFGSAGLWKYMNNSAWSKLSDTNAEKIFVADLDGNGTKDIVADFGSSGLYEYMNGTTWTRISATDATDVTVADLWATGASDLVVDFGAAGLYKFTGNSTWTYLSALNADRTTTKDGYANTDFTGPVFTETYNASGVLTNKTTYDTITYYLSGRMESKRPSASPDASGNVYYHYKDEDYAGQGYGRVDVQVLGVADADGAIAYAYEYHPGVNVVSKKTVYKTADYSTPSAPVLTTKLVAYEYDASAVLTGKTTYYNDANNYMQSKTLVVADASGNVYYHYMNELASRLDGKIMAAADAQGAIAYTYQYNGATTDYLKQTGYATGDYSNPNSPVYGTKLIEYEYQVAGPTTELLRKINYYNDAAANYMEAVTYVTGKTDGSGNVYFHYIKEDFGGTGYGRVDGQVLAAADATGAIAYTYQYHGATAVVSKKTTYSSGNYADPKAPVYSTKIREYEYDAAGTQTTMYTFYRSNPTAASLDGSGDYLSVPNNAAWNFGTNNFTVDFWVRFASLGANNGLFGAYGGGSSGYQLYCSSGALKLYNDGSEQTLAGSFSAATWYHIALVRNGATITAYVNGSSIGTFSNADLGNHNLPLEIGAAGGGSLAINGNIEQFRVSDTARWTANFTAPTSESNDANTKLLLNMNGAVGSTTFTDSSSNGFVVTAYGNAQIAAVGAPFVGTNYMESKTLAAADASGNLYYHFMDEDWASQGYGRVDKQIASAADADGATAYYFEYHAGVDDISRKVCYSSGNYADPAAPAFTGQVAVYEYDATGVITTKYTYYAVTGRLETKSVPAGDASGNEYYHYLDTAGNQVNVMVKKVAEADGTKAHYYEYDGSGNKTKEEGYTSCDYSNIKAPVLTGKLWSYIYNVSGDVIEKYAYYSVSGRLEAHYIAAGDGSGNDYYHYADNAANDLTHKVLHTALADGTRAYYYEYDGVTGNKTKEEGYSGCDYADMTAPVISGRLWTNIYDAADGTTILEKYTYYFVSQRVESKIIPAGDASGNEYYQFADNAAGDLKVKVLLAALADGTKAYYYEYDVVTGKKVKEEGYAGCNYSDPKAPDFTGIAKLWTITYDAADGTTILDEYTYYNNVNNRMESHIIPAGDASGNEYYHYLDDAASHMDTKVLKVAAADGTKAHFFTYDASGNKATETGYSSCDYSDPTVPVLTGKLWEYIYNVSGDVIEKYAYYSVSGRLEAHYIAAGDGSGNDYYHYADNAANDLTHKVLHTALADGTRAYYYEYDGVTGNKTKEEGYSGCDYADMTAPVISGRLWTNIYDAADGTTILEKYTYYFVSQRVESKIIPAGDASGNEYYQFADNAAGDLKVKVLLAALADGTKAYYYEYDVVTGKKVKEEGYAGCDYSDPKAPDFTGIAKLWTITYDAADGTTILDKYTYYNNVNNRMESHIIPAGDVSGNEYYHYLDDAASHLDVKVLKAALADGTKAYYSEYDASGNKTKETGYTACDYSDPKVPTFTGKIWELIYNTSGDVIEKYTYYSVSGRMESHYIAAGDGSGNDYYHYADNAAGDLTHKVLHTALADGTRAYYYEYDGVTGNKTKEEGYSGCDYADVKAPVLSGRLWTNIYDAADGTTILEKYTYYFVSQRVESKIIPAGDASGNEYYHYADNAAGDLTVKVLLAALADGTKAYYYEYDAVTGKKIKEESYTGCDYSDPKAPDFDASNKLLTILFSAADGTTILEQYVFYNDATNYLEAHELKTADAAGNVYYHFLNEDYNVTGQGRLDEKVLGVAEADGTKGYTYTYAGATGNYATVIGYTTADYSDLRNAAYTTMTKKWIYDGLGNLAANMTEKYTYFTDATNYMQSKTLRDADAGGNVYYRYLNEDFGGTGYGRVDTMIRATADATDNAYAYLLTYHGVTNVVATKECYAEGDYANPASPVLGEILAKYEYDALGVQTTKYTYYYHAGAAAVNWMESKTLAMADASGNVYYHWMDEDFNAQGYGRLDRMVLGAAEADGTLAYYYEYSGVTGNYTKVIGYSVADYSDPKDPDLSRQVKVFMYDGAGNLAANITEQFMYYNDATNYLEAHELKTADVAGNVYYHFLNEDYNVTGQGRLDEKVLGVAEADGTKGYTYTYTGATGNYNTVIGYTTADYSDLRNAVYTVMTKKWIYDGLGNLAANMTEKYTYFTDATNYMQSKTLRDADAGGNVYYRYLNEDYAAQGYGRVDRMIRNSADATDGAYAYEITYHGATNVVATKICYAQGDYADPNAPVLGEVLAKYIYDAAGVQTEKYTYYYDALGPNYMESKTLAAADASGNVYYHYILEAFYDNGTPADPNDDYGRVDRIAKGVAEADGTLAYYYEYSGSTVNYTKVIGYAIADYSNPKDAQFSRKIKELYYDGSGNLAANITQQYVYYNDATNYMEAHSLAVADASGNVYYHFLNENYNLTDQGRLDEKVLSVAEADGTKGYTYTYTGATGNYDTVIGYTTADYSDLRNAVYTVMTKKWIYDGLGNLAANMTEKYTYFTDATNYMQSKTLRDADAGGNVYYRYINENYGGTGYGRVDRIIRNSADATDAAYAYEITYNGATNIMASKTCYSEGDYADPANPVLGEILAKYEYDALGVETTKYTYYYHAGAAAVNWMESKTLATADASGNVYYHWMDEDFNAQGYGRLDRIAKGVAEADGTLAYYYEYSGATGNYTKVIGYAVADYSDPKDPDLSRQVKVFMYDGAGNLAANITEQYVYYNDATNYMEAHSLKVADASGNVYYHFLNENYNLTDQGRLDEKVLSVAEADGTKGYTYTYAGATGNYDTVIGYANADYSDLRNAAYTRMIKKWIYDGLDNLTANMVEKYTYYNDANNYMQSKTLRDADAGGNVYYRYINENYGGTGYGRVDRIIRNSADATDAAYAYEITYNGATNIMASKTCYSEGDYADPANPVLGEILAKYEYDALGVETTKYTYYYHAGAAAVNWMESKTLATADASGNVYYHWMDEDFNAQGYGRLDRIAKGVAEADGTLAYYYEYSGATGNYTKVIGYAVADYSDPKDPDLSRQVKVFMYDGAGNAAGNITEQYVYYNDLTNYLEAHSMKTADVSGNVYYHFLNENYNLTDQGRLDEKVLSVAEADGTKGYTYTYAGATGNYDTVIGYANADYSDLRNAAYTRMIKKWIYDGLDNLTANMVEKYTYYNDANNYMQSKTLRDADAGGNVYYRYINENYGGTGYGRVDRIIRNSADATDAAYAYEITYNGATNIMASKTCYSEGDYADPANPVLGEILAKYEYDALGVETTKYTYYYHEGAGAPNYMESKTLATADAGSNVYYHYMDENFNSQGYGRVDKQVRSVADAEGSIAYYYEYQSGSSSVLKKKVCYKTADYSNPKDATLTRQLFVYEYDLTGIQLIKYAYYDDAANLMESKTLTNVDGSGNLYYQWENNDFYGNGQYGRLVRVKMASNGHVFKTLTWYDGTDIMKKREEFTSLTEATWVNTYWYYNDASNSRMSKKLQSTGVAYQYFNDASNRMELKWDTDGQIYHYTNEDSGGGYGNTDWQMNATHDRLYVYRNFYAGTKYPAYKDTYVLRGGTSDTWDWTITDTYSTGWVWTGSTTDPAAVGNPPASITQAVPAVPVRADASSLIIDGADILTADDGDIIPAGLEYFNNQVEDLKGQATGEGVTVAVLDSGIGANDVTGHGTKMAEAVKSIASGASIMDAKVLDEAKETTNAVVAEAIKSAVDNGARVLSMSFSLFPVYDDLKAAIDYAAARGAILVAAAGNEGTEILDKALAAQDNVITVGSVDKDGKLSAWSNYGDEVDLYAPWDVIEGQGSGVKGQEEAGTSYSAAFVAGLAALILEDNPDFTSDDVLTQLKAMMPAVTKDAEVKEESEVKIKGVSVDEVVSMQDALRKQKQEFTGTSVEADYVDANAINQ